MKNLYSIVIALVFTILCSCSSGKSGDAISFAEEVYIPADASGFTIMGDSLGNRLLSVADPWQGASGVNSQALISSDGTAPEGFDGLVLNGDARRIVAMSSTYVAMLDRLGAVDRVVGVSGIGFISNPYVQAHSDEIVDVGNEEAVDFENLVALQPDLVLIYGVSGPSAMETKLKQLGLPYLYIGDYLEQSPLGKAEWIVAIGELVGKRDEAIAIYEGIKSRYMEAKEIAARVDSRPKVMINVPYADSWFMPSVDNYIVRLIEDAGGDYIYKENRSNSSVPIEIETAYMLASEADVWLHPGRLTSLDEMKRMMPRFAEMPTVKEGKIYNNDARSTAGGGNDFYESGALNPDVVLRDLVAVFHPELTTDTLTYYRQLR